MRPGGAGPQPIQLPTLAPWMRNLLIGLFALFVVELVLRNVGLPIQALAWHPFEGPFQPWQPITRYLVQGGSSGAVLNVLFGLLVLYFLLPAVDALLTRAQVTRAVLAGMLGGTLVPLVLDALFLSGAPAGGWTVLTTTLVLLFGLAMPTGVVNLWFVIPITGRVIVWGTLGLAVVFFLIDQNLSTAEALGTWLGVYGWWVGFGPGSRRRTLKRQARKIERQLQRFEVIEGGRDKDDPKGRDDWIH